MFWMKLREEAVGTFQVDLMLLQNVVTARGTADSGGRHHKRRKKGEQRKK